MSNAKSRQGRRGAPQSQARAVAGARESSEVELQRMQASRGPRSALGVVEHASREPLFRVVWQVVLRIRPLPDTASSSCIEALDSKTGEQRHGQGDVRMFWTSDADKQYIAPAPSPSLHACPRDVPRVQGWRAQQPAQLLLRLRVRGDDRCPVWPNDCGAGRMNPAATLCRTRSLQVGQGDFFDLTARPLIDDFVSHSGRHFVLFAYGVTASGKTFTVEGTDAAPGILPRALQRIFDLIAVSAVAPSLTPLHPLRLPQVAPTPRPLPPQVAMEKSKQGLRVVVSNYEVYNDQLYDLLSKGRDADGLPSRLKCVGCS